MKQSALQTHEAVMHGVDRTKSSRLAGTCIQKFSTIPSRATALLLTCTLALFGIAPIALQPAPALGETTEIDATPDAFQLEIEKSAQEYNQATEHIAELEQQIVDNEAKITEIEANLPEQQQRGANAFRALYKLQQEGQGLLELVLNAENLNDFLRSIEYLDCIQQRNLSEIARLQSLQNDLSSTQTALIEAKDAAYDEQQNAEQALVAAQTAREEAQHKAQAEAAAQAEAQKQAEEQAASNKNTAVQEDSTEDDLDTPVEPSTPEVVDPPSNDNADWGSDKETFVATWGGRIDAYLAGSPMSGQGATFAEAAWNYGVDPRWSPAISNTESSKGAYCFNPHNAWGWGSASWDNWEDAINSHVSGLAAGYGYTLSVDAAKKYCPPNWQHWYDVTRAQMDMI